jgi:CRP/FNR family transcriptional regulator, cyclic AMP receptor protein
MNEHLESLRQVPLFKALPLRSLELIDGLISEETHEGGAVIIREGDEADRLFVLIEGVVSVVKGHLNENASPLGFSGPVTTFGEIGLIDGGPRSATVLAVERCRFLVLNRAAFQILLQHNIDICHRLLLETCERLRHADEVAAFC